MVSLRPQVNRPSGVRVRGLLTMALTGVVVLACGGGPLPPEPPRAACQVDSDCVADGLGPHPSSADPCCTGYAGELVSAEYEAWRVARRAQQCTGREVCPPLLPPAPPPPGFFDARCDAGTCARGR